MFNFFNKQKTSDEAYKVFKTEGDKYRTLINDIEASIHAGNEVILLYFFKGTGIELESLLTTVGISFSNNERTLYDNPVDLWSVDKYISENIISTSIVWVAEFHPLRSENLGLLQHVEKTAGVLFYSELDNVYFKALGMEKLPDMMEKLGVKDTEAIEHSMVNKSILRCQEKMEKEVKIPQDAPNLEEWMNKNYKKPI